jgi:hypothetical protein
MSTLWWRNEQAFCRDLPGASAERLAEMLRWATDGERAADAPGMGRSPKVRRMFRMMRVAAEAETARRGPLG